MAHLTAALASARQMVALVSRQSGTDHGTLEDGAGFGTSGGGARSVSPGTLALPYPAKGGGETAHWHSRGSGDHCLLSEDAEHGLLSAEVTTACSVKR